MSTHSCIAASVGLDQAQRNTVVYRCLTPDPAQALLLGNGHIGCTVHTPDDSLYLLVARSDTWNEAGKMGAIAAVRIRGPVGFFAKAKRVRQECRLGEACVAVTVDNTTFTITALRDRDLLVVDIAGPSEFAATIENWHDGDETTATETVHVNRTSEFAALNARVKVDAAALGLADPLLGRAWGLFLRARPTQILIAAVCESESLRARGRALLAATDGELAAWREHHRQWWAAFWSRSYLQLESATGDAEYEERLWYVALYCLGSGHGGAYPMRFNGGAFLLDRDQRMWDWGYWFQNMRELYWPLFASGHWDLAHGFFQMYFDALPFAKAQTWNLFGVPGVSFRETQMFWGVSPDTDLVNGHFNPGVHHYFSGNLEVCLLMDWYCRASGDEAFLRDRFFPFLKEILTFYRHYMKVGEDGRYHLAPANALEIWRDMRDPMPDVAGLHYLLPRFLDWARQYGEPVADWEEFHAHLPLLPVGRWTLQSRPREGIHADVFLLQSDLDPAGVFLPAADKATPTCQLTNMENPELYVVYPWGLVGLDSPPPEQRRIATTWNHRSWRLLNNGWAQDVLQLARMGWADKAVAASREHASRHQRFPNGCFICAATPAFHGLLTANPYFDSAGVHATGLNEMLLQSYNGTVRLCPATSAEWSGRFKLHAFGGFVVEARFVKGRVVSARITATRTATLQLPGQPARSMQAGELAALGEDWREPDVGQAATVDEIVYPGYKQRPPGVATRTGHWHDESTGHGQVGLAAEALFPATCDASDAAG